MHWPLVHVWPAAQAFPHAPQFELVVRSVHPPGQQEVPPTQLEVFTQLLPEH